MCLDELQKRFSCEMFLLDFQRYTDALKRNVYAYTDYSSSNVLHYQSLFLVRVDCLTCGP